MVSMASNTSWLWFTDTTPEDMTQALNDSLEARVRQHMGQWLWFHNRWKEIPAATAGEPEEETTA